ncbi:hypothetical protein N5079_19285 [Planotetraspora sp. A-T 1434]|uniref:hypothetical protein n=1 Tax=Planotetraspora sp. A-T 1434 TaxID=2979219 RepID=UPI0021BFDA21|nr:hypothetical protein [Planotetraspora sp. A-T 1434]MCT9932350.1 hypothetical protein [Planotetraspora sp. A-T 1434]
MARKIVTTIGAVAVGALALAAASAPAYADVAPGREQGPISSEIQSEHTGSRPAPFTGDHQTGDGRGEHGGEGHNDHHDGDNSHGDGDGDGHGDHHQWGHWGHGSDHGSDHGSGHDENGHGNHHGDHYGDHGTGWNQHGHGWNGHGWDHDGYWNHSHYWNQWSHKHGLHIVKWHFSHNDNRATRITGFQVTPGRAHEGDRLTLDGTLHTRGGANHYIGRQRIHVYFRSNGYGGWRNVDTITTDSDGGFRTDVRARRSGTWLVKFNGNDRLGSSEARDYVRVAG